MITFYNSKDYEDFTKTLPCIGYSSTPLKFKSEVIEFIVEETIPIRHQDLAIQGNNLIRSKLSSISSISRKFPLGTENFIPIFILEKTPSCIETLTYEVYQMTCRFHLKRYNDEETN